MTVVVDESEVAGLVARARAGEPAAIEGLVARYRPMVFRYCLARLGTRETADDVTQETCIAMVQALPRYRDEGRPFGAFVIGIASNKCLEAWRGLARRREDVGAAVPERPSQGDDPAELAVESAEARRAMRFVNGLSPQWREIVLMRVAGASAEEVAAALGMTAGAVRVAQHRALGRLRQAMVGETR